MEVVLSVQKISEQFLIPILEVILDKFPFILRGFHSDNGSEYINKPVLKLLNKLLIEFTKSRYRHSNDNALAESNLVTNTFLRNGHSASMILTWISFTLISTFTDLAFFQSASLITKGKNAKLIGMKI